ESCAAAERLVGILPVLCGRGHRGQAGLVLLVHAPGEAGLGEVARRVGGDLADLSRDHAAGEACVQQAEAEESFEVFALRRQRGRREEVVIDLSLETTVAGVA